MQAGHSLLHFFLPLATTKMDGTQRERLSRRKSLFFLSSFLLRKQGCPHGVVMDKQAVSAEEHGTATDARILAFTPAYSTHAAQQYMCGLRTVLHSYVLQGYKLWITARSNRTIGERFFLIWRILVH